MYELSFHHQTKRHHYYTLGTCATEFMMVFALHVLAPLHMVTPAVTLTAGAFVIYSVLSFRNFRLHLSAVSALSKE